MSEKTLHSLLYKSIYVLIQEGAENLSTAVFLIQDTLHTRSTFPDRLKEAL